MAAKQDKLSFREKLHNLPLGAGVAIMIALLAVSLFAGNFRALSSASPKDFIRQGEVRSIIEDRIAAANNAVTVANRAGLSGNAVQAVRDAVAQLEKAKTARDISRADQLLTAAVSELTTAQLTGEDERSMLKAADTFAEMGSFLRQEARAFNREAEKAEALYEILPTKFLFAEPDVYEGI